MIENHLHAIGKSNQCGRWVSHKLTDDNKMTRITDAEILLRRTKTSGFLDSIVMLDEQWICFDNTRRKRQLLSRDEQAKSTPEPDCHGDKVMICMGWNTKGLMHFELLNPGQKITTQLYSQELNRVCQALQRKRVDTSKTKFLQINARPHIAKITQQEIEEMGWELLPHPPYSLNLTSFDYYLFRSIQHFLEEQKFKHSKEVKIWGIQLLRRAACRLLRGWHPFFA